MRRRSSWLSTKMDARVQARFRGTVSTPPSPSGHPCPPWGASAGHVATPASWEPLGGVSASPLPTHSAPGCLSLPCCGQPPFLPELPPIDPPRPPLQHPRVSSPLPVLPSPLPCTPFHLLPALPSLHPPGAPPGGLSLDTCPGTGEVVSGRCICPCLPARCPPPSKSSPHPGLRTLGSMSGWGCEGSARRAVRGLHWTGAGKVLARQEDKGHCSPTGHNAPAFRPPGSAERRAWLPPLPRICRRRHHHSFSVQLKNTWPAVARRPC